MGYAALSQVGSGIRQRIFSRAFIIGEVDNPDNRFVYLVLDTQSGDTAVRYGVLEGLAALGDDYSMYGQSNIALTGTHQHSGPGAWVNYLLPQITSLGFDHQSYQAIVDGVVLSIQRAHESLTTGYLSVGNTTVTGANINRSLYAYLANPEDERDFYGEEVDKTLTMMRFQRASDGKNIGVLSWFAVHGTSMLENNTHVTGDNKGVAAYLFEKAVLDETDSADDFVAGFSQANVGDTTPNVEGAYCENAGYEGQMCTLENSTCGGSSEGCHGRGPFWQLDPVDTGAASCYEIGRLQYAAAKDLYDNMDTVGTPITDQVVRSFHSFQQMTNYTFALPNGTEVRTCAAALGYSFAAGTSDGPGAFDFTQGDSGDPNANPLWSLVVDLIKDPDDDQRACQAPKPILLDVGQIDKPYPWSPDITDMQVLRVGQMLIIVSPSEASTMAGRRWRNAIRDTAISSSLTAGEPWVVLGAPANSYSHYLTTPEEYAIQRYEGASTLYGQWELAAYVNLTTSYLPYLAEDATGAPPAGPSPPDNRDVAVSFITGVVYDTGSFGDIVTDVDSSYAIGDTAMATFVGANPRNNLRLEGTYAAVDQLASNGSWVQYRDDWDWSLMLNWTRTNTILGTSEVKLIWETDGDGESFPTTPLLLLRRVMRLT